MKIKLKEFFDWNHLFCLLKIIFQVLCLIILLYQFIDITHTYLNFCYEIKLSVDENNDLNLPSITFCLKRGDYWLNENFKSKQ